MSSGWLIQLLPWHLQPRYHNEENSIQFLCPCLKAQPGGGTQYFYSQSLFLVGIAQLATEKGWKQSHCHMSGCHMSGYKRKFFGKGNRIWMLDNHQHSSSQILWLATHMRIHILLTNGAYASHPWENQDSVAPSNRAVGLGSPMRSYLFHQA